MFSGPNNMWSPFARRSGNILYWSAYIALISCATYVHTYFGEFSASFALAGFSPLDLAHSVLVPENFEKDYPGGAGVTLNSVISWLYPLLYKIGLPINATFIGLVFFEIAVLTLGASYLLNALFNKAHPLTLVILTLLLVFSWVRFPNLGRFTVPYFHGQFYGYADGFGLAAIGLFINKKNWLTSISHVIGFMIHPIKAVMGFAFTTSIILFNFATRKGQLATIAPVIFTSVFIFSWIIFWLGGNQISGQIPDDLFFRYSPLLNSHWYPQDLKLFDVHHWAFATPFFSAVLISFSVLLRADLNIALKQQLAVGILTLLVLVFIGVVVSWYELSVVLVKASLQRASTMILGLSVILLLGQFFSDIKHHRYWYVALSGVIFGSAFFEQRTWPVALSLLYAGSVLFRSGNCHSSSRWLTRIVVLSSGLLIVYQLGLYFLELQPQWFLQKQLLYFWQAAVCALALYLLKFLLSKVTDIRFLASTGLLLVFFFCCFSAYEWSNDNRRRSSAFVERALAYMAVQKWARDNTPVTSLFMVDPYLGYGWRDYSMRSSFGTVHEWYKTGWLYSGDKQVFEEGLARGARLGIDDDYIFDRWRKDESFSLASYLGDTARTSYYAPDGELLTSLSGDYEIDFFVMERNLAKQYGAIPDWPVAYENSYFVVIRPH